MPESNAPRRQCVVALDSWVPPPNFNFDHDVHVIENIRTNREPEILKQATIYMTSGTPLGEDLIDAAPHLQLVSCSGVGTDHIAKLHLQKRGIRLTHVPAQNVDSVSEHAFAMYYALRRRIIPMHQMVIEDKWPQVRSGHVEFGRSTRVNEEEILCIIGYGSIGKNVEKIGKALGMKVLIAERKGAKTVREGRTEFNEALKTGTVFIITAPLDDTTKDMIGTAELAVINKTSFIVNVGRGGIIDEQALVEALKSDRLAGAATDVFKHEPVSKEVSPLLDPSVPNLILSPHIAWYATRTLKGTIDTIKSNVEAFVAGKPQNVVV